VNRPAIDDLLASILSSWYESVAEWMPPGQLSAATCSSCRGSALADVISIGEWPHDLMHQLATQYEEAIGIISESLEAETDPEIVAKRDAHALGCPDGIAGCVRAHVISELHDQRADLLDVLCECVTPRLDEWVSSQAISLTPHLRG